MDISTKLIFIVVLSVFFSKTEANDGTKAKAVLDKTVAYIGNKNGASADFQISSGKIAATSGSIAIKGNRFHMRTPQVIIWFDGKTQWTYTKKTNEVNVIHPFETGQMIINPYTIINTYRSGYNLAIKTIGNNYQVHLSATEASKDIKELYILVDGKTYAPLRIKMRQKNEWTIINITNFKTKNIPNSDFYFKQKDYPTAEVIDLR